MLNNSKKPHIGRKPDSPRLRKLVAVSAIALIVLVQSACFFSKKAVKIDTVEASPVRVALLPFNVPSNDADLRYTSMAAPILMAKAGEQVKGLEIMPLWETMPTALNTAGTSRTFTPESAATVANWLSAKWSVLGEISPEKSGYSLVMDFIPARSNMVPFRFLKSGKLDTIGESFGEAYVQFLRYLSAKPFEPTPERSGMTMTSIKNLAEALDREYGWSGPAEPGKAQDTVAALSRIDEKLARELFSPSLYPSLAEKKEAAKE